jgi:hypothetical protein
MQPAECTPHHVLIRERCKIHSARLQADIVFGRQASGVAVNNILLVGQLRARRAVLQGFVLQPILKGEETMLLIILILLIVGFGYGGYRVGPGWGYYGGGSLSLILTIIVILLLLKVI